MAAAVKVQHDARFQNMVKGLGFEVLYPTPDENATLKGPIKYEIVAVPGIGTDDVWSWKYNRVNWLKDQHMLSKKIPDARISSFNYSAEGTDKIPIYQRLEMIAKKLLLGLNHMRSNNNTKTPIIFVCHSMGGIVLAHMLSMAQASQDEYRFIYPYVAGAIFLGTPFRGTSEARALVLAEMAQSIVMSKPADVVSYLERDNALLDTMFKRFVGVFQAAHMRLYCFYEEEPVKGSSKRQDRIVDAKSAEIDGVGSLGLKVDHFQLNKYDGAKDPNYTFVSEEIRAITSKAESILKTRQNAQIQELVDDLTYSSMKNNLIKPFQNQNLDSLVNGQYAGSQSSRLLEQAAFGDWKQQDTNKLLWVHGEAGTGQNAVASSAIASLKASSENGSIVTSFYCDEKGEVQSRSFLGLLHLIIWQIIKSNRDLAVHLLSDSKKAKQGGKQGFNPEETLRVQVLWDTLQSMAKYLSGGSIYIIVYGLEQLLPDALDEFLSYLTELSDASPLMDESYEDVPIKWMLLSRSGRPNIEKSLSSRALEIDLRDKATVALISNDLRLQISARVNELELPSSLGYFVKRHVHSRAEDNEIYIKLVIQELKNAWRPGKTQHADIRKLLESFPYGLANMFEHIQKRVLHPQAEGLEYTKEILRCQICAHVSPTLRDLAVMAGLPKEHREDLEILKSYIVRCGAFLTVNGDEWDLASSTVEWINISAQDYLKRQAKDVLTLDLQDVQNGIIALRCLEYVYEILDADIASRENSQEDDQAEKEDGDENDGDDNESLASSNHNEDEDEHENENENENASSHEDDNLDTGEDAAEAEAQENNGNSTISWDDSTDYPFRYWVEHAKLAPRDMLDEFDLENRFWRDDSKARQKWWQFNQHMELDEEETVVSALQMAVILQFPALVEYLLEHGKDADTHTDDSSGFQPLYYACQGGNEDIVNALLGANANINYTSSSDKPTALHAAASRGHLGIVQILLDRDADIDATSPDHGTALYAAVANQHHKITELLLERDAKVNLIGGAALRPLNVGALVGNLDAVRELIDHDADIDPDEEYWYGSALGGAARNGHVDMVEFLISSGWSPTRTMKTYGSFLTAAATYKHLAVVEILLEKEERTPVLELALQAAAQRGYVSIVEAILDKKTTLRLGKVFSKAAYYGRTEVLKVLFKRDENGEIRDDKQLRDNALYQATDNEHEETVKMLLEYGADPNAEGPTYGFALTASAYDGTTGIMQALLAKGADVNKRGGEYGTALQAAAFRGDSENVELLLNHGAVLNTDPIGYYGNELQAAVFTGDETTIKLLIDRGANVNAFGGHYSYAIIAAVQQGYSDATKVLLENNADVNVRGGRDNFPVISLAASTLRKEDLKLILDRGADINATCDLETAALLNCAATGDDDGLEFLLEHGADVHMISPSRGSALHVAAEIGNEVCCEILLKAGADVNAIGGEKGTPLQYAAWSEDIETVRFLLNAGADVTSEVPISGSYGTALQAAAFVESVEIVRELLDAGAAVNVSPANGEYGCALSAAACVEDQEQAEDGEMVRLLLDHGADVNFEGGIHHLPLMSAAQVPNHAILELLLEHGADARGRGGQWGTTLIAAAHGNSLPCVKSLVDHGADVHATGGHYGSALQAAAIKGDMELIEYILDHAPELVNFRDGKYHTPLIAAAYFGRIEVVEKLLNIGANFQFQGGKFRSVITAAAIKGHKAILEKFLNMGPDERLIDEALVEAVAHRQAASVDLLLQSRANVMTRHPTLGTPSDALEAPEIVEENSDDENLEDDDDDDDDDSDDDDDVEVQWEGDDGSVAGDTEDGSVKDLQLEEELTDTAKIQKLLEEAVARRKRNPTVERFKSVRHRGPPPRFSGGYQPPVPPLPASNAYASYNPSSGNLNRGSQYGQQPQQPLNLPLRPGPNNNQPAAISAPPGYPTPSAPGSSAYPSQILARKPVGSPSGTPQRGQSPHDPQQGQNAPARSQGERQHSGGNISNLGRTFTPPSRNSNEDTGLRRQSKAIDRRSIANPGAAGRYQPSFTPPQESTGQSIGRQDFAGSNQPVSTPPAAPYTPYAPQQQYPPPLNSRQSQQFHQPSPPQNLHQSPPLPHRQSQQFNQPQPPQSYHQSPPPQQQQFNQPSYFNHPQQPQNFNQSQPSPYQSPVPPPSQYQPYASPPMQQSGFGYAPYNQASQGSHHPNAVPHVAPPPEGNAVPPPASQGGGYGNSFW